MGLSEADGDEPSGGLITDSAGNLFNTFMKGVARSSGGR
jgi:hypothetical protein